MDKEQYKRVMERIQMPEGCEERILATAQAGTMPKQKKQLSTMKKSGIALAVAACIGAVTILPIAAEQNENLLHLIFPFSDSAQVATDVTDTNTMSTGNVENFQVTGMDGMTITPMGVINDAKSIYLMMHVVPDASMDLTNTAFLDSGPVWINGEICYTEEDENGPLDLDWTALSPYSDEPLEDGSYNWVYELRCEKDVAVDCVDVTFGISSLLKSENSLQELGTISATLELGAALESRSFTWDEPIAVGNTTITNAELSCFSLEFNGNGGDEARLTFMTIPDMKSDKDCQYLLHLADGSTVEMRCNGVSWYEAEPQPWNMICYFEHPVNPADVVSVQLGDTMISLT